MLGAKTPRRTSRMGHALARLQKVGQLTLAAANAATDRVRETRHPSRGAMGRKASGKPCKHLRGFQQGTISMSILVEDHFIHLVICHQLSCVQNSANVSILHNLILTQFLMAYILYVIESSKQNRDLTSTGSSPEWWQQPDLDQAKAKGLELPTCSPRGVAGALS